MTLINQTGITVFRAIAAIGRAVVLCNVLAFIYIAYALLFCGFIIPYSEQPTLTVWDRLSLSGSLLESRKAECSCL